MKADTDQLIHLIKNVKTYPLGELSDVLVRSANHMDGVQILTLIARTQLELPTGTVFKIEGLDHLLTRTTIIGIAGRAGIGNIILCIDKATLEMEEILYNNVPTMFNAIRCLSFPKVCTPLALCAIDQIVRLYKDLVTRLRLGCLSEEYKHTTLLSLIFEFVITGKAVTEITSALLD